MSSLIDEYRRLIEELPPGLGGGIDLLLSQMSDSGRRMLRRCAIPHQFDRQLFFELDPSLEEKAIDEVFDEISGLSTVTLTENTATMHDDVRGHLFGQWLQEKNFAELAEVSRRLVDYYSRLAAETVGEVHTGAELQRIFHLLAVDQEAGFSEFQQMCRRERYRNRLHTCETLIQLVREYEPVLKPGHKLWLHYHEAKLLLDLRRFDQSREVFESLYDELQDYPELKVRVLWRLGFIERDLRNLDRSEKFLRAGLDLARQHQQLESQELRLAPALASVLMKKEETSQAQEILDSVIKLAASIDDKSVLAVCYNSLGELHRILAQPQRMIEAYQTSLEYIDRKSDPLRLAQVYANLGGAYAERAEWELAKAKLEAGRDLSEETGDSNGLAIALSNLARVYHALGDYRRALEAANKAIDLFIRIHNWHNAGSTSLSVGRYFRRGGDLDSARSYLSRAADYFNRSGDLDQVAEAEDEIGRLGKTYKLPLWAKIVIAASVFIVVSLVTIFFVYDL